MSIIYDANSKTFAIQTNTASYVMMVDEGGALRNLYWGKRIENYNDLETEMPLSYGCKGTFWFPAPSREEYTGRGRLSYEEPCLLPEFADGTRDVILAYQSHRITQLEDGEKLSIIMKDEYYSLFVELVYRTYNNLDIISKNAIIKNSCKEPVVLDKMKSGTVYVPWARDMRLMYMQGRWGKEAQKQYVELPRGRFVIDNNRGTSSGPHFVPFFALDEGNATETQGDVWYGLLQWSGNFKIEIEHPYTEQITVTAGVNDFDCEITLNEGESFETPVLTIGYSKSGYEKMSETLYDYQFDFLAPRSKINNIFPIIYNSWYPYEMDVNEEKCLGFIDKAKEIGAELFVIDDGWMKDRCGTKAGLGTWYCDSEKFPNGLKPIADKAHANGMLFGLWIEPEMVNEDSDTYRQHPEWVLTYPTREKTKFKDQCVLNLACDEVREYVWETVDRVIGEFDLDYLKWDMNSYVTEAGTDKAMWVKYTKNLYEVWRRINEKYPKVLLENCAHGGARADYGMMPYSDRINRSDNADPVDVLKLHEGFSTYILPKYAGGAGNIATSPNHMHNRISPLKYRAYLGMTGSMSIGINILKASRSEIDEIKEYIRQYKTIRHITQNAYVYRLASAFENSHTVWEYLKRDRKEAVVFMFAHGMNFKDVPPRIRLRGLDPKKNYKVSDFDSQDDNSEVIVGGDILENFGLRIEPSCDYDCKIFRITEVE